MAKLEESWKSRKRTRKRYCRVLCEAALHTEEIQRVSFEDEHE